MSPNVAASVKVRLLARAKAEGEEFERTLTRFGAERLLYRLGASDVRDRCLLKGASLLSVWLPDPYRVTRDVDLLAFGAADEASVRALIEAICDVPSPEDALRFDLSGMRVEAIRAEDEYAGQRARFVAHLGNARIHVQVDFGFGDAGGLAREEIDYPVLLPDLPAPRVCAYPREASVAEKLEAMVKLDIKNSRMKDFHDIWALSTAFAFDGPDLQQTVFRCFERRATPWTAEMPRPLTTAFYRTPEIEARWRSYLTVGSILVPPPAAFETIGEQILRFVGPVRESLIAADPFEKQWPAGGPWMPGTSAREGAEGDV
jgi:hypothetical protein